MPDSSHQFTPIATRGTAASPAGNRSGTGCGLTCTRGQYLPAVLHTLLSRNREFISTEFHLGRTIGTAHGVTNSADDEMVWTQREARPSPARISSSSLRFWNSHALVWGAEPVVPETETIVCPW